MTALTVPLDPQTEKSLDDLASATQRTKADIAAEAISTYVRYEADIVAKIKAGLADVEAGRTVPHKEVMREMRQLIKEAKRRRR